MRVWAYLAHTRVCFYFIKFCTAMHILIRFGWLLLLLVACTPQPQGPLPYYGLHDTDPNTGDTIYHKIRDFSFVDQDSQVVNNATFAGKVYIGDFFFTSCPTICPKVKKNMLRIYERYRNDDRVMLLRDRRSRIYYLRQFFDYPITLGYTTLAQLGIVRSIRIGFSYLWRRLLPIKPETNLEQFLINRFGRELYLTFFKSYTEKVWGTACEDISAEWGAQRIKGLSILKAVVDVVRRAFRRRPKATAGEDDFRQKGVETSLIERFLYPKLGPGQMWEEVARRIEAKGGTILLAHTVDQVFRDGDRIVAVGGVDRRSGERFRLEGDHFFSTMAMKDLAAALDPPPPPEIAALAEGLVYRDFLTVGVLAEDLEIHEKGSNGKEIVRDNWIYIQEPDVVVGRLQIFNNWSPAMIADPSKVWIGLEYFCNEGDAVWSRDDAAMIELAKEELARIGILDPKKVLDAVVIKMPKTYPAYFGTYDRFPELRTYFDTLENLFLIGRNGMHRYNNQDHSMLTAMTAVDNLVAGRLDKANIWEVNTEEEYHEEKK